MSGKLNKFPIIIAILAIMALGGGLLAFNCLHKNNDQNWQIVQSVGGDVTVKDSPGWYWKGFSSVWTWPRATQAYFSESSDEGGAKDESIMVTFNDGGQAKVSTMIRYQMPVKTEQQRSLHRDFSGNPLNVKHAIRSHMINCMKAAAPLMSASEHQSARKAEYTQLVNEQLKEGLYVMNKIEKVSKDQFDKDGKPITTYVTEIVFDTDNDGVKSPRIAQTSPLKTYGITILQFSITGTNYDKRTREQFAAKKEMFLKAEQMKAEKEQEVQQRLMVIEKGEREKAEITAKGNVEKAAAVIKAQKEKEMAEIAAAQKVAIEELAKKEAEIKAEKEKKMAEIAASQKVAVEEQAKKEEEVRLSKELMIEEQRKKIAEVEATKKLEVAKLEKSAAVEKAEAIKTLALAEEERIKRAGAITEQEKTQLEIAKDTQIQSVQAIAQAVRGLQLPSTVIMGNDGAKSGTGTGGMDQLMKLFMLKTINSTPVINPITPKK